MASDDLDSPPSSSPAIPSQPFLDSSFLTTSSPTDNRGCQCLSRPTLKVPQGPQNLLDPLVFPTYPPNIFSPPFSESTLTVRPPDSTLYANSTHDNDPEEHDGSCSSDLPLHRHGRRRKGGIGTVSESSIGSSSTECGAEDNSSPLHPSPLHPTHSDVTTPPTLTQHTTPDTGSRPVFVTRFLVILERIGVRRPPLYSSRETDIGLDTTQNDGQKGDSADVKCKGAEPHPTANESPASEVLLPPDFTDSSHRQSPPPPPFPPISAEPQGLQSRELVFFSIGVVALSLGIFGMTRLKGILR